LSPSASRIRWSAMFLCQ